MKGGTYFTLCSSAVMVGAGFSLTYESGKLYAYFAAGLDVLVVFDPLFYSFHMYLDIEASYGRFNFNLGADLLIEGPKMRGVAEIEICGISAEVKFGPSTSPQNLLSAPEFIAKHVMRDESSGWAKWIDPANGGNWVTISALEGVIRPTDSNGSDNLPSGLDGDPWILSPRFSIGFTPLFPSTQSQLDGVYGDTAPNDMHYRPMGKTDENALFKVEIKKVTDTGPDDVDYDAANLSLNPAIGMFVENSWGRPVGTDTASLKKAPDSAHLFSNFKLKGTCEEEDGTPPLNITNRVETCEFVHALPLSHLSNSTPGMGVGAVKNTDVSAVTSAQNNFLQTAKSFTKNQQNGGAVNE